MISASTQGVDKGVVINENQNNQHKKRRLIVIVLLTSIVVVFLLLVAVMCYLRKRKLKSKGNSFLYLLLSRILDYLPLISQSEKKKKKEKKRKEKRKNRRFKTLFSSPFGLHMDGGRRQIKNQMAK
jgi:flagellar basal body-associated protein FliL